MRRLGFLLLLLLMAGQAEAAFVRCYQCCPDKIDRLITKMESCAVTIGAEARAYRALAFRLDFQDPISSRYYAYLACRVERRHLRLCAKIRWLRYARQRLCAPC